MSDPYSWLLILLFLVLAAGAISLGSLEARIMRDYFRWRKDCRLHNSTLKRDDR